MSIPEFELILDKKEKNMGNPEKIFAFVILGFQMCREKRPNMSIQDILYLKDEFDKTHGAVTNNTTVQTFDGTSRRERRAMEHNHTRGATKKKKGKGKKKK